MINEFEDAFLRYDTVADFNIHMNQYLATLFGIHTAVRRGTELGLEQLQRKRPASTVLAIA